MLWSASTGMFERVKAAVREVHGHVYALYRSARDDRTPLYGEVFVLLVVAYIVSPIDPVPDIIPVLGFLDEALLLLPAYRVARWMIPAAVWAEYEGEHLLPVPLKWLKWGFVAVVILFWVATGYLVWSLIQAI